MNVCVSPLGGGVGRAGCRIRAFVGSSARFWFETRGPTGRRLLQLHPMLYTFAFCTLIARALAATLRSSDRAAFVSFCFSRSAILFKYRRSSIESASL